MKSLIEQLRALFDRTPDEWHHKAQLTRMEFKDKRGVMYSTENVGRRLRDLEREKHICVEYDKSLNARYRRIPENWRDRYITADERAPYSNAMWKPAETKTLTML